MKKWIYIGYVAAWIATSAAVITGIIVTKSLMPLWAFIIPGGISLEVGSKNEDDINE